MTNPLSEKPEHNPDDDLSIQDVILKYQLDFTKHFGPKNAYGVRGVSGRADGDVLTVIARVKRAYQPMLGPTTTFSVEMSKFRVWRNNIKLYSFIS